MLKVRIIYNKILVWKGTNIAIVFNFKYYAIANKIYLFFVMFNIIH